MMAQAISEASALPKTNPVDSAKLVDSLFHNITVAKQGEVIFSVPVLKKYTYQAAKGRACAGP